TALDEARAQASAARVEVARLTSEASALERDHARLAEERTRVVADLEARRRQLGMLVPERDHALDVALADADRVLTDALDELAGLRAASDAAGEASRAA